MAESVPHLFNQIHDVARNCANLFDECLSKDQYAFARLEVEERRFWIWSNSLKVFAKQHINLDAQLRLNKHVGIREMVFLLLNVLEKNLSLGIDALPSYFINGICSLTPTDTVVDSFEIYSVAETSGK